MSKAKIIGLTASITFFMLLVLSIFIKALSILLDPFFHENAVIILFVTGILLLIGVVTGTISLATFLKKS